MTTKQKIKKLLGLNKVYLPYKVFLHRKQELNRIIKAGVIPVFNNQRITDLKECDNIPYSRDLSLLRSLKVGGRK